MSFVRAIPSTAESAKQLIADAMAYLSQVQAEGKAGNVSEFDFRLALDEAVQNAYLHGNGRDPGKRIHVSIKSYKQKVQITVCDEGNGFHADALPDPKEMENRFKPHGRGVCLLKNLFRVNWSDGGRCVRVEL